MAIRLKVDRLALIEAARTALGSAQQRADTVRQEQEAYDWRPEARKGFERLTTALEDPTMTQESWDSLLYQVRLGRDKPDFERQIRGIRSLMKDLQDFIDLLEMNSETQVSVSTGDAEIMNIIRDVRVAKLREQRSKD